MWPFIIIAYPQTLSIITFRFGHWVLTQCDIPILRQSLYVIYFILQRSTKILTGIEIGANAKIGQGLYIAHCGTIIISNASEIGNYPMIFHNVTVGFGGRHKTFGSPKIGDYAFIGVGSTVIGKIKIGDNVVIGANSLVIKDVPDNAVVGGVPSKILNYNGSKDFITIRIKL